MRAIVRFGDFVLWDYPISDEQYGRPIILMSPMGQVDLNEFSKHPNAESTFKRMEFIMKGRLDHDLVEYVFNRFI